jgi:hypothetical protein
MTPEHRNSTRAKAAAGLAAALLTLLIASALHHPGHAASILLVLTAALGATTATLALAVTEQWSSGGSAALFWCPVLWLGVGAGRNGSVRRGWRGLVACSVWLFGWLSWGPVITWA